MESKVRCFSLKCSLLKAQTCFKWKYSSKVQVFKCVPNYNTENSVHIPPLVSYVWQQKAILLKGQRLYKKDKDQNQSRKRKQDKQQNVLVYQLNCYECQVALRLWMHINVSKLQQHEYG